MISKPILNLLFMEMIDNMWFNQIMMRKGETGKHDRGNHISDRFAVRARLNVNDLLRRRRTEEKQIDKKANLIILSSAATLAVVVLLILNL